MENLLLLAISIAIFMSYVWLYVYPKYGVLKSVSDSVYHIKHYWLFSIVMMSFPLPFIMVAENVAINWLGEFAAFFAGAGICFVGAAPCFVRGQEMEEKVHVIGATGGIILGTLFIASFGIAYCIVAALFALFVLYCHFVSKAHADYRRLIEYYEQRLFDTTNIELSWIQRILLKLPSVPNHTWWIELIAYWLLCFTVLIRIIFY